jgi:hypothetical protein
VFSGKQIPLSTTGSSFIIRCGLDAISLGGNSKHGRDASVDLATLAMISRTLRESDIADALVWIEANRTLAAQVFKECNP